MSAQQKRSHKRSHSSSARRRVCPTGVVLTEQSLAEIVAAIPQPVVFVPTTVLQYNKHLGKKTIGAPPSVRTDALLTVDVITNTVTYTGEEVAVYNITGQITFRTDEREHGKITIEDPATGTVLASSHGFLRAGFAVTIPINAALYVSPGQSLRVVVTHNADVHKNDTERGLTSQIVFVRNQPLP